MKFINLINLPGSRSDKAKNKVAILVFLYIYCIASVMYAHIFLSMDSVVTHFFYIPIALTGIWFGYHAVWTSVFLGGSLLISHIYSGIGASIFIELQRATMFVIVGLLVSVIMNQRNIFQKKLKESSDHTRALWDNSRAGIMVVDMETRKIVDMNLQVAEILDLSREKIIGREFSEYFSRKSDSADQASESFKSFDGVEYKLLHPDGRHMNVLMSGTSLIIDGRSHSLLNFIDISEINRARKEIEHLKKQMEFVIDVTKTGLDIVDSKFNIRYIDPVWEKAYGKTGGRKCHEYFMDLKDPCPDCGAKIALAEKSCTITETVLPKENNKPVHICSTPFQDETGEWLVAEVKIDISERRRTDEKIRRQAALIDITKDAIVVCTMDGIIDFWNRGAEIIFGWKSAEIIGRKMVDIISENNVHKFEQALEIISKKGELRGETSFNSKDGKEVICDSRWTFLQGKQGNPDSILCVNTDITAKKELEYQLRHSQRMESVGRLAGGVAHDFNNYLTAIIGSAELLMMKLDREDRNQEHLSVIFETSKRAAHLTQQLLAFSHKQVTQPVVVNLNDVLSLMKKMCGRLLGEDVEYHFNLNPDVKNVYADPGQLEQIILNLIINSREAMPHGGLLRIATKNICLEEDYFETHSGLKPGNYIRISVSDNGEGMNRETADHIFEPFYTTKENGTGLGLSTVYGIVRQLEGDIHVYSEKDRGTTFKIYIPAYESEYAEPDRKKVPLIKEMPKGDQTILLIEDEASIREFISSSLPNFGYKVITFVSGNEALSFVDSLKEAPDLLFTDVILPDIKGTEVAKIMNERFPSLKVLFMSGYTYDRLSDTDIVKGKTYFLQKPFSITAMIKKIQEIFDIGH